MLEFAFHGAVHLLWFVVIANEHGLHAWQTGLAVMVGVAGTQLHGLALRIERTLESK